MTCLEFAAWAKRRRFSLYVKEISSLCNQRDFPTMNPFPFKFNNPLFNGYHLFWQNNCAEHEKFPISLFHFWWFPIWILSHQSMRCKMQMNATVDLIVFFFQLFLLLYQSTTENRFLKKSTALSIFMCPCWRLLYIAIGRKSQLIVIVCFQDIMHPSRQLMSNL